MTYPAILASFAYANSDAAVATLAEYARHGPVLIDSGAFTVAKTGRRITVEEYAAFLAALPFTPFLAFTLDVIGDAVGSRVNTETLWNKGCAVVPVITRGANLEELQHYRAAPVVAVGGLVKAPQAYNYLAWIMPHLTGQRVHWLGVAHTPSIAALRPYSCDTSAWRAARVVSGIVHIYKGAGKNACIYPGELKHPTEQHRADLALYGYSVDDFRSVAAWRNAGVASELHLRSQIRRLRDLRRAFGVTVALAGVAGTDDVKAIMAAAEKEGAWEPSLS